MRASEAEKATSALRAQLDALRTERERAQHRSHAYQTELNEERGRSSLERRLVWQEAREDLTEAVRRASAVVVRETVRECQATTRALLFEARNHADAAKQRAVSEAVAGALTAFEDERRAASEAMRELVSAATLETERLRQKLHVAQIELRVFREQTAAGNIVVVGARRAQHADAVAEAACVAAVTEDVTEEVEHASHVGAQLPKAAYDHAAGLLDFD
jgi:hypothetical protein